MQGNVYTLPKFAIKKIVSRVLKSLIVMSSCNFCVILKLVSNKTYFLDYSEESCNPVFLRFNIYIYTLIWSHDSERDMYSQSQASRIKAKIHKYKRNNE